MSGRTYDGLEAIYSAPVNRVIWLKIRFGRPFTAGHKVTVHGMRSLITDVLNEQGFNSELIERQLDHLERNPVRAAYLRTSLDRRRKRCNGLPIGATVALHLQL